MEDVVGGGPGRDERGEDKGEREEEGTVALAATSARAGRARVGQQR